VLDGYSFLTLAGELSREQIQKISRHSIVPLAVVVQGTMVIGVTKNLQSIPWNTAPAFALLDEKNRLFRVLPDGMHDTIICNTDELTLIDHVPELVRWGIQYLIIDARARGPEYTKNMISLYTEALYDVDPMLLKSSFQKMITGRCTSSAWNRGL
jgi:collagenase-like PrtC family protease